LLELGIGDVPDSVMRCNGGSCWSARRGCRDGAVQGAV